MVNGDGMLSCRPPLPNIYEVRSEERKPFSLPLVIAYVVRTYFKAAREPRNKKSLLLKPLFLFLLLKRGFSRLHLRKSAFSPCGHSHIFYLPSSFVGTALNGLDNNVRESPSVASDENCPKK